MDITLGQDGSLWFAESNAHKIGQLVVATATDQGQATFNDSGTWTFYQAVALVPLLPPSANESLAVTARGPLAASVAVAAAPHCLEPTFIVRNGSSGNDNAEQIAAASAGVCADIAVGRGQHILPRSEDPTTRGSLAAYVYNRGPDVAVGVRVALSLLTPEVFFAGTIAVKAAPFDPTREAPLPLPIASVDCVHPDSKIIACTVARMENGSAFMVSSSVYVPQDILGFSVTKFGLSITPDPYPRNNFGSFRVNRVEQKDDTLPTDPRLVVLIPVRGHPQ
jgi:hypothetical protein